MTRRKQPRTLARSVVTIKLLALDLITIGAVYRRLKANGWRNRDGKTGGRIFVIERGRHAEGDANHSDVAWALMEIERAAGPMRGN